MLVENQEQIILLDVRTEKEYSAEYIDIDGAELMNIPVSDLESRIDELENSKVIIVYCRSGGRSSTAKNTLAQHDFIAYNMLGGITAWKEAKYDTSMSTGAETTLPSISPVHTPAAASTPVTSHTPTPASEEEEKQVPGFELIFAFAAISLIAWRCRVLRKQ
ncbi:Rhodanese-related sulfurtransferase [Candidatus Methanophagaceae archaeon]|jgi:rhodanese-related sulfurtransferase|nr:Rhodanese-related sulfurtransferase [Methanophagales archaeon]